MIFMVEENKATEEKKEGKIIVISKRLIIIAVSIVIVLAISAFLFYKPTGKVLEDDSPVLGDLNATVYVVEFSDYECPFCQAAEGTNQEVIANLKQKDPAWQAPIPNVIENYVNTGKVKLVFRQFPVHGNNNPALATKCAQEQGKFWEYHKKVFENYNAIEITNLKKYAVDLNLNLTQFNDCLDSKKYLDSVQRDVSDGQGIGVSGTPTFFIGNEEKGYEKIVGAEPFSNFSSIINSKL